MNNESFIELLTFLENKIIKLNSTKWNFYTNATSENFNQYLRAIEDFISFITNDSIIQNIHKNKKTLQKSNIPYISEILTKLELIKKTYSRKSVLTEELFGNTLELMKYIINYRIQYHSKESTTNYIADLCQRSTSLKTLKSLQKNYYFQDTPYLKDKMIDIINIRNAYARERGFDNFFTFSLYINGINSKQIKNTIKKVHSQTHKEFVKIKKDLDNTLAKKLNCRINPLPSYVYGDPFFRYYPIHLDENVNIMFKGKDIAYAVKKFYSLLDIDLGSIYEVSDLYIRPGKYQNQIIIDINRKGDVRFSLNAKSNFRGIYHLLRTMAKLVYILNINNKIPFILKTTPNRSIVEGFSQFMTKYALTGGFISKIIAQYDEEDEQLLVNISDYLNINEIIYIRFFIALSEFESELYKTPSQNISDLWLKTVEKYQLLSKESILCKDAWVMIDTLLFDPLAAHFELEGFLLEKDFFRIQQKTAKHGKHLIKYIIDNLIQYGYKANKRTLKSLSK